MWHILLKFGVYIHQTANFMDDNMGLCGGFWPMRGCFIVRGWNVVCDLGWMLPLGRGHRRGGMAQPCPIVDNLHPKNLVISYNFSYL